MKVNSIFIEYFRKKKEKTINEWKNLENEFYDLLPIEDLTISVDEIVCEPFGKVMNMNMYNIYKSIQKNFFIVKIS